MPDRPEQAQGCLASSLSAKVRMEGPNRAHCVLGGVLGGLGTQRSVSRGIVQVSGWHCVHLGALLI